MTTCDLERSPDPPVKDPPAPVEQPVPVEEPPPGEPPTQEPPLGPDEVEAPVRDPRVPGTPTRKEVGRDFEVPGPLPGIERLTSLPRPSDKS
jgi:hypothetical protein